LRGWILRTSVPAV